MKFNFFMILTLIISESIISMTPVTQYLIPSGPANRFLKGWNFKNIPLDHR